MVGDTVLRAVRVLETMPWTRLVGTAELNTAAGLDLPSASSLRPTHSLFTAILATSELSPPSHRPLPATPRPNPPTRFRAFRLCPSCEPTSCDFGPPLSRLACSRAPQAGERPCALAARRPSASAPRPSVFSVPPEKTRLEGPALNAVFSGSSAKSRSLTWGAGATCFEVPREQARQEKENFKLCTSIAYH